MFEETHSRVISLVHDGVIDGVRIDHPDGLADPAGYLLRLRDRGVERVWVEKILDPGERLRDWPVSGTVGYEFLNDACALFVDPAGEGALTSLWQQVSGDARPFGEVAHEAKLQQVRGPFAQDVDRLLRENFGAAGHAYVSAIAKVRARARVGVHAGVPNVHRSSGRARGRRGPPRDRRVRHGRRACRDPPARAAGATGLRHPLPADHAGDHGQGRRGHRVLSLQPADRPERRGRRSVALRDRRRALPRGQRRACGALPPQPADHHDPRRQALGRRAGTHRSAGLDAVGMAGPCRAMVRHDRAPAFRGRSPGRHRALLPVPDPGGIVGDRARADRGVHGEGAARGQAQHELGRAEPRVGGGGEALRQRAVHQPGTSSPTSSRLPFGWPWQATGPRSGSSCSS